MLSELKAFYAAHHQEVIGISLTVLILGIIFIFLRRLHIKTVDEKKVLNAVKNIGQSYLHNVVIPDGLEGYVSIDYLVRTASGIVVLDIQHYGGLLFGAETIDLWTQKVKRGSFKFPNPIRLNQARVQAVKALAPGVPVFGRVVFTSDGHFPKGMPNHVSMLDTLKDDVTSLLDRPVASAEFDKAWENLAAAQTPNKAYTRHAS